MKTLPLTIHGIDAKLTIVSDDHLHVEVIQNAPLVLNRVPAFGRLDLYHWSDHTWRQHPEWADGEYTLRSSYRPLPVKRADKFLDEVSEVTAKKFRELLTEAVEAWYRDSPWAAEELAHAGAASRELAAKNLLAKMEDMENRARRMREEVEYLRDGGRIIYYIKTYESGWSETRRAIVTIDGQHVDTVEQPGDR